MPVEVQSELCRQNLIPSFPHSRRSIVAEHPLVLLEQLLMNEKVRCCVFYLRAGSCAVLSKCCQVVRPYSSLQHQLALTTVPVAGLHVVFAAERVMDWCKTAVVGQ